jgi:small subunit ribosomal protein S20
VALREANRALKSQIKTAGKRVNDSLGKPEASARMAELASLLDKAVKKGIMHKNAVARRKSQYAKLINKSQTPT